MKTLLKSVAAAAVLAVAGAAHAVPVTLTGVTLLSPASPVFGTLNGAPYSDGAGALRVDTVERGSFIAFCIELDAMLSPTYPVTYDYTTYTQDGVARVLSLYGTGAYSAAATQVAIWEAVYDSVAGNLSAGVFTLNAPAGLLAESTALLAAAGALTVGQYDPNSMRALNNARYQDLVTVVPEPSTYALLLAGLTGIGFVARRRSQDRA
jgi:hypothetical protein